MKAALFRTGSIPVQRLDRCPSNSGSPSPRLSLLPENGGVSSPRNKISLRSESGFKGIRRSSSDSDMIRSDSIPVLSKKGSMSFPDMSVIDEQEMELDFTTDWPSNGNGKGNGGNNNNNGKNMSKIGEYYRDMLKSNPGDSLLLRNYGKYLHEVEKNVEKAEEYYGRAILASPGDGELLSLYGSLIWETQKDEDRAQSYFDQAVHAAPDDCMVLGSYAHFLWEADEDEEDVKETKQPSSTPAMVGVY